MRNRFLIGSTVLRRFLPFRRFSVPGTGPVGESGSSGNCFPSDPASLRGRPPDQEGSPYWGLSRSGDPDRRRIASCRTRTPVEGEFPFGRGLRQGDIFQGGEFHFPGIASVPVRFLFSKNLLSGDLRNGNRLLRGFWAFRELLPIEPGNP